MGHTGIPSSRRSPGFSLIELLVVITVVIILAAILLPAVQGVRARATLTVCLSHARGIGQAIAAYVCDSDGILPPGKYGHQGGSPLPKVWTDLLYEGGYLGNKEGFQCPADDVTNNASRYYDVGPAYPQWWASYAIVPIDLSWETHSMLMADVAKHRGYEDMQILLGESESNFITANWFGWGNSVSFKQTYIEQFPFDRHTGRCSYVMLDGHAQVLRVPATGETNERKFEAAIRAQFRNCAVEGIDLVSGTRWTRPHVCFWNDSGVGLGITPITWNRQ